MKNKILFFLLPLILLFGTGAGMQGERPGAVGSFNVATGAADSRNAYTQFQINGQSWGQPLGRHATISTDTIYNDYCGSIYNIVGGAEGYTTNPTITIHPSAEVADCEFTFILGTDETVTIANSSAVKFRCGVGITRLADVSLSATSSEGAMIRLMYTNDGVWQCLAGDEDLWTYND